MLKKSRCVVLHFYQSIDKKYCLIWSVHEMNNKKLLISKFDWKEIIVPSTTDQNALQYEWIWILFISLKKFELSHCLAISLVIDLLLDWYYMYCLIFFPDWINYWTISTKIHPTSYFTTILPFLSYILVGKFPSIYK